MQQTELELSVGDVIQLGDQIVTVVEIHDDEVTFKIVQAPTLSDDDRPLRPR